MSIIYVLQLEKDKLYIGRTDRDPEIRFKEHVAGRGSAWTKKYPPIKILETKLSDSIFDEDKIAKEYMVMYGIDNVRGGSFTMVTLPTEQKETIKRDIWSAQGRCTRCGRDTHFIMRCRSKTTIDGDFLVEEVKVCTRCNRDGHSEAKCYATTTKDGACIKCRDCYAKTTKDGKKIE